ncbi:MAG: hypothetical protein ACERKZ_14870 [Lachnotalea sp.]
MEKTKLGLSIGLVGAALYFFGCISVIPAFLLAGYILLFEENAWLKKSAVKMIIIVVSFGLLLAGVGIIQNGFDVLRTGINLILPITVKVPLNLDQILIYVLHILQDVILIIAGFKALSMGTIKSNFIDKIIDKHM